MVTGMAELDPSTTPFEAVPPARFVACGAAALILTALIVAAGASALPA
jgi:hypothetical protein